MAYPTNPIYKLVKNPITGVVDQVKMKSNNGVTIIPFANDNSDYQEYLGLSCRGKHGRAAD